MPSIPSKVESRLVAGIKRFQPILENAKARDVNESDTAIIITDLLSEVFGYDKYSEITSEYAIRGTCCDLAIKLDGECEILLEIKPIGMDLKEHNVKQAIDYAANEGIEWVILTNGVIWNVYKVSFAQPIDKELVVEFDFLTLSPKNDYDLETLFMLSKEGQGKSVLDEYHSQRQAMSRFFLGAMVVSDVVVDVIRRELRKISPGIKIDREELRETLQEEVLKREVLEGDKAVEAKRKISRAISRAKAAKEKTSASEDPETFPSTPETPTTASVQTSAPYPASENQTTQPATN